MESNLIVADLIAVAHGCSREGFVLEMGPMVLVGSPIRSDAAEERWSYSTSTGVKPYRSTGVVLTVMGNDHLVFPLKKAKPGAFADTVLIGRTSSNDIAIDDPCISKLHARIKIRPDEPPLLSDAGSHNGTIKNGTILGAGEPAILGHRDELNFGGRTFLVFDSTRLFDELRKMKLPTR